MREILESCVQIDQLAARTYRDMAARCADHEIAEMCAVMASEEEAHVQWWSELLEAWDAGLLPDVWSDTSEVIGDLVTMITELERFTDGDGAPLDAETVLTTAARIEFFALHPAFAELIELAEPGIARSRHDSYSSHVDRLITMMERSFPHGSLMRFFAQVLHRSQRENSALSRFATRDPLTGLGNRRALAAQASQWAAWASRYGCAISFLLLDVDDFRKINETWGHAIGDEVLKAVAEAISGAVRRSDLVARYGGDEFIVLAPELEPDGARILADRLVACVREMAVEATGGAVVSTTASVGIATMFDPPDSEPRSLDVLLAAADRSLYAAKQAGRDRSAEPVLLLQSLP